MSEAEMATANEAKAEIAAEKDDEVQYLVTEFRLHNLPRWKRELIDHIVDQSSLAVAETLAALQQGLVYEAMPDAKPGAGKQLLRVLLKLVLPAELRPRIANLLDPQRKPPKEGKPQPRVLNSYGFIGVEDGPTPGTILATVRLMERITTDKTYARGPLKGQPVQLVEKIAVTTGLQQLIASFVRPPRLMLLPRDIQQGVAQEIGQQLMSHIMLKDSGEIKEANFPSVEERDPARRLQSYQGALATAGHMVVPFARLPYPQAHPKRYARIAACDPEVAAKLATKEVIADRVWDVARTTPHPPRTPVLIVSWKPTRLLYGEKAVEVGVSRSDMAHGIDTVAALPNGKPTYLTPSARKEGAKLSERARRLNVEQAKRRARMDARGTTTLRKYFLELPLLNREDPVVRRILKARNDRLAGQHHAVPGQSGRGWDFQLKALPFWGGRKYKASEDDDSVLFPIEMGRTQEQAVLRNDGVELCWSRLVVKKDGIYWQLTFKRKPNRTLPAKHVLGVHFGLDNVAYWCVLDKGGQPVLKADGQPLQGKFNGNPQLAKHLESAQVMSWDQKAGRWVGGRGYGKALRTMTYNLVHRMVDLAIRYQAVLAVEEINWVDKAGRDLANNRRFSGWNYGQLCRILEYKGPLLGIGDVATVSDYVVNLTCPNCGAIRKPKQKPEVADTVLERDGGLLCRKCGHQATVLPSTKAVRVAKTALGFVSARLS